MIWLLLAACIPTETLYEVQITGSVSSGVDAPIFGEVLLAQVGEGALAHGMVWVEDFELDGPGAVSLTTVVPGYGEGLALYAWQDTDGDGLLCALGGDDEPTGAGFSDDFPSTAVTIDVTLDAACLGPERYARPL